MRKIILTVLVGSLMAASTVQMASASERHHARISNRAIASELVIGEETVKSHSRAIYRKLGVGDRASAVAAALREGVFQ